MSARVDAGNLIEPSPRRTTQFSGVIGGKRWIGVIGILLYTAFVSIPFLWMATISVKPPSDYIADPPVILPSEWTWNHFAVLGNLGTWDALRNSVIVATVSSLLSVIVGGVAGYAIARYRTGGQNLSLFILSQRLLPPIAAILPIFVLLRTVRLIDSHLGLVLLYTVFTLPFTIWIVRSYFLGIPADFEDAARLEGANQRQILYHIGLPLGRPAFIAAGGFAFVVAWTEFLFAVTLTRTNAVTLPVVIGGFRGVQANLLGELAAMALIGAVPVLIVGALFHKYAVSGLTMGGIEG
jgi:multiple sugar transport system permease protein